MSMYRPPLYAPHLPPVFVMMNRAGSVGKTTFANTVFVEAAIRGYQGLIVDADLQSDMSRWFGYDGDLLPDGVATVHDVMLGKARVDEAIVPARTRVAAGSDDTSFEVIPNLDLVRGDRAMRQADGELVQDGKGIFWLQQALKKQVHEGRYDFIVIDSPASYGRLSESLLLAGTDVITMMRPMRKELRGAQALAEDVASLVEDYEDFGACVRCTWYCINDAKSESQGQFYVNMQEEAQRIIGDERMLPPVKNSVVVAEAYDAQEPLPFWSPKSPAMAVFREITDKVGFPAR